MAKVSAVVATLNEEDNIRECLKSVSWVDEIIVVDSYSEDSTVEIAEKYADKIIEEESKGYMEPHRNRGIREASNDWIVRIDADEVFPDELNEKLRDLSESDFDVIYAPKKNIQAGRWIKSFGGWSSFMPAMFRKSKMNISDDIHTSLSPEDDAREKYLETDEGLIVRHETSEDFSEIYSKMNRYTKIEAERDDTNLTLVLSPIKEFLKNFIYQKGFLHGREGFVISVLNAQYEFMKETKKMYNRGLWENE